METSDRDLRDMVREVIARHSGHAAPTSLSPDFLKHASHGTLILLRGGDSEGRCLIEPAVACTHCGYCQSLGH